MKLEFVKFQENLYLVKRLIKEDLYPNIDVWKEHLKADIILKKEGILYFLQLVPDLEIIEEFKIN